MRKWWGQINKGVPSERRASDGPNG